MDDSVEDQVPSPGGGTGDGNGDGIPDAQQPDVASLPNSTDGSYVTLISGGGVPLRSVQALVPGVTPPTGVDMAQGLISFRVEGLAPGSAYSVTLILHAGAAPAEFWKFGPTSHNVSPHWYPFAYNGQTGAVIEGNRITLHFVDGQRGDGDLLADGRIQDPGGPALRPIYGLWMPRVFIPPTPTVTPTVTPTPTQTPTPTAASGSDNPLGSVVPGLSHPNAVAVHQGQNRLFITSRDNNRLLKVNPADNTVEAQAETGPRPWGVTVMETTDRVYVSNYDGADVWVYSALDLALLAKIPLGNGGEIHPGQMAALPGINTVAVAIGSSGGAVAIIEGLSLTQWVGSGGAGTFGIAADPVGNRVIISNRDAGNMRVLRRTEFGQWLNDGQLFTFSDRRIPFEVAYNPTNGKLYQLYVINTTWAVDVWGAQADGQFVKAGSVPVGNSGLSRDPNVGGKGLAIDMASGHLFVANTADNTVTVIHGGGNQVITTLSTGLEPIHLAVNALTRMVYVLLRAGNQLAYFVDRY